MRYAHVEDGVVVNVVIADDHESAAQQGWVRLDDDSRVGPGWGLEDGEWVEPDPPVLTDMPPASNP